MIRTVRPALLCLLLLACSSGGGGSGAEQSADGQGDTASPDFGEGSGSADASDAETADAAAEDTAGSADAAGDALDGAVDDASDGNGEGSAETDATPDTPSDTDGSGAGVPSPGFGTITGSCGVLDEELLSPDPTVIVNAIDFGTDPWDNPADLSLLSAGGQEMVADGNAGGSSLESEIFSYEVLHRCEGATLVKTETEVVYDIAGSITDILVEIDGMKVGVSVTRAVGFPRDAVYPVATASTLLSRKLTDIQESSANVSAGDRWVKQILHVIAYADQHVAAMAEAYNALDASVKADTILWITRSDGDDEFIY